MNLREAALVVKLREILPECDDLRRPPWRGSDRPTAGHCYVASEVLYHALGGREAGYTVWGMVWEGSQHWWLRAPADRLQFPNHLIDPTWDQFDAYPDYTLGRRRSFLTNAPSKRAVEMARRAGIDLQKEG